MYYCIIVTAYTFSIIRTGIHSACSCSTMTYGILLVICQHIPQLLIRFKYVNMVLTGIILIQFFYIQGFTNPPRLHANIPSILSCYQGQTLPSKYQYVRIPIEQTKVEKLKKHFHLRRLDLDHNQISCTVAKLRILFTSKHSKQKQELNH